MARTQRTTTVVGNPAHRAFGFPAKRRNAPAPRRSNPAHIIGYTLAGNPGRKKATMAKTKKRHSTKRPRGYAGSSKMNPRRKMMNPARRHHKRNAGVVHHRRRYRNPGSFGEAGVTGLVTNAVFVIIGALGSKLGAQAVLGTNNVGVVGYAGNAAIGAALWFITEKLMKNRAASAGVISGTLVQILLRVINDYTPFGSYVAQLGMGDYQMQSFVTPQILVDPFNSAQIRVPNGWGPGKTGYMPASTPMVAAPGGGRGAAAPAATAAPGMSGLYGGRGGPLGRGLYAV